MPLILNGTGTIGGLLTGGLPNASVTAASLATNAARTNFGAGAILQVVQTISTLQTESTSSTTTFYQIASLNTSITPSSASSKILVLGSVAHSNDRANDAYGFNYFHFSRGGSPIGIGTAAGSRASTTHGGATIDNDFLMIWNSSYLDSPGTTSSITYGVQTRVGYASGNTFYLNKSSSYSSINDYYIAAGSSSLILLEVAG